MFLLAADVMFAGYLFMCCLYLFVIPHTTDEAMLFYALLALGVSSIVSSTSSATVVSVVS
jgi:hypothetical protein